MLALEHEDFLQQLVPTFLTPFQKGATRVQHWWRILAAKRVLKTRKDARERVLDARDQAEYIPYAATNVQKMIRGFLGRSVHQLMLKNVEIVREQNMEWRVVASDVGDEERLGRVIVLGDERVGWNKICEAWNRSAPSKASFYPYQDMGDTVVVRAKRSSQLRAARKIQMAYKRHYAKKLLGLYRQRRQDALKEQEQREFVEDRVNTAAKTIQSNWKGYCGRYKVTRMRLHNQHVELLVANERLERKHLLRKADRDWAILLRQHERGTESANAKVQEREETAKKVLQEKNDRPNSSLVRHRMDMVRKVAAEANIVDLTEPQPELTFSQSLPLSVVLGLEAEEQMALVVDEAAARKQEEALEIAQREDIVQWELQANPATAPQHKKEEQAPSPSKKDASAFDYVEEIPHQMMTDTQKTDLREYNEMQRILKIKELITTEKMKRRDITNEERWGWSATLEDHHQAMKQLRPVVAYYNLPSTSPKPTTPLPYHAQGSTPSTPVYGNGKPAPPSLAGEWDVVRCQTPTQGAFPLPALRPGSGNGLPNPGTPNAKPGTPSRPVGRLTPLHSNNAPVGSPTVLASGGLAPVASLPTPGAASGGNAVLTVGRPRASSSEFQQQRIGTEGFAANSPTSIGRAAKWKVPEDDEGLAVLSAMLPRNLAALLYEENGLATFPELNLDLSGRGINDHQLQLLCGTLTSHPTLKSLNLDNNQITNNGCEQLAIFLATHPAISSLSLKGNPFSGAGVNAITHALLHNCSLVNLELGNAGQCADAVVLQQIQHILKQNKEAADRINSILHNKKLLRRRGAHKSNTASSPTAAAAPPASAPLRF
eukprot:TRINITY_DN51178_c0_g2_i1.p1 TRINITY_DN51178_c0_g2~~TRINITY_DN51178_c0_g2_i1.p1  ORF type:complete len:947 (+),score=83.73 TRINITY_DN51178_c0_g2_i1:360-2843(+)